MIDWRRHVSCLDRPGTTKPYKFIGFGAMEVTKPYEFIRFGAMDVTKPCEFIRFGAMDVTKTYEFIGVGAAKKAQQRLRGTGQRGP